MEDYKQEFFLGDYTSRSRNPQLCREIETALVDYQEIMFNFRSVLNRVLNALRARYVPVVRT